MGKNKTTETENSVDDFLAAVPDEAKRADSQELIRIMQEQTGCAPRMWGPSIIGFGSYHYKYESGHEGDAPLVGFSPRNNAITLYIYGFSDAESRLEALGKHKSGKSCIYIKKLTDIDLEVLSAMITDSIRFTKTQYPVNSEE